MRILGFVILIVAVAAALWNGALVNLPSLLIVIGLPLTGMVAAYGMDIGIAFRAVFSGIDDRGSLQSHRHMEAHSVDGHYLWRGPGHIAPKRYTPYSGVELSLVLTGLSGMVYLRYLMSTTARDRAR